MKIFEVGGCVRDEILGLKSNDVDFVVVDESFDSMRDYLITAGFNIFIERPEFLTIRAAVPKNHPLRARTKDADFVLARKDSPTSDGRRPDFVEVGTLEEDLARRDFTINAIAKDSDTGELFDPFGGRRDLEKKTLRFVGQPDDRIREDGLRVLRGFRFQLTKGLEVEPLTWMALHSKMASEMLLRVSVDRIRNELEKMLRFDNVRTLRFLGELQDHQLKAIFREGLRLSATLKE